MFGRNKQRPLTVEEVRQFADQLQQDLEADAEAKIQETHADIRSIVDNASPSVRARLEPFAAQSEAQAQNGIRRIRDIGKEKINKYKP